MLLEHHRTAPSMLAEDTGLGEVSDSLRDHTASRRCDEAVEAAQHCGLACPREPQEDGELAGTEAERHVPHGHHPTAIRHPDVVQLDHCRSLPSRHDGSVTATRQFDDRRPARRGPDGPSSAMTPATLGNLPQTSGITFETDRVDVESELTLAYRAGAPDHATVHDLDDPQLPELGITPDLSVDVFRHHAHLAHRCCFMSWVGIRLPTFHASGSA